MASKDLRGASVEIPRLPPKPTLTALTGGYRRTPVMQIGADIYCDSQCIIRELERRFPSPSLMPTSEQGLMWCLSRWTDGALFDQTVRHVLGAAGDQLDQGLCGGSRAALPRRGLGGSAETGQRRPAASGVSSARTPFMAERAIVGRAGVLARSAEPAAIDAQFYHVVWFSARPMGRRAVISVGIQRPCPLGSEYPGHRPWNLQRYGSAGCHFARK